VVPLSWGQQNFLWLSVRRHFGGDAAMRYFQSALNQLEGHNLVIESDHRNFGDGELHGCQ